MGKRQSLQRELHNKALGVRSHPCPRSPVSPAPSMVCNAHWEFGQEAAELGGRSSAPNKELAKEREGGLMFPAEAAATCNITEVRRRSPHLGHSRWWWDVLNSAENTV